MKEKDYGGEGLMNTPYVEMIPDPTDDEDLDLDLDLHLQSNEAYVKWTKFISAVFLSCCCAIGLYGNLLSLVIFSHRSMNRSSINFLLAALSVTDMLLLIMVFIVLVLPGFNLMYPTAILDALYPYAVLVFFPISSMTQTCSVWTFVLISIERYMAVVKPLQRHKLLTMREAKLAQILVYFCGISYNVIRFWEYKLIAVDLNDPDSNWTTEEDMDVRANGTTATEDTMDDDLHYQVDAHLKTNYYYDFVYSTILHLSTHFILPFTIIVTCHLCVVRALRRARRQIRSVRRSSGSRNRGTTFMIMTVTLAFVLFNVLPLTGDLWETLDPNLYDGPWMRSGLVVSELSNCLSVLNSSCTFCIYLVYCKKYRRLFRRYSRLDSSIIERTPLTQNESLSYAYV